MRNVVKLNCSICLQALRYDAKQKAMVCATARCKLKGAAGTYVHVAPSKLTDAAANTTTSAPTPAPAPTADAATAEVKRG